MVKSKSSSDWKVFKTIWFSIGGIILAVFLYGLLGVLTASGSEEFGFALLFAISVIGFGGYLILSFIIFLFKAIFSKNKK